MLLEKDILSPTKTLVIVPAYVVGVLFQKSPKGSWLYIQWEFCCIKGALALLITTDLRKSTASDR